MKFLISRLYDDPYNIELRHYYLIELILNEKWNEIFDILEETPFIHCDLIEFALKYIPLRINNNEQIEKLKERLKSFHMFNRECLIKNTWNRDYKKENISFSSSSSSIETLNQTILFLSKGKIFKKILNWIEIGRGECEIIEDNQSGKQFLRFWIIKNHSIELVLLLNLNQLENISIYSIIYYSFIVQFNAKNQCDYPNSNDFSLYQIQFYSLIDAIQFKNMLSLKN